MLSLIVHQPGVLSYHAFHVGARECCTQHHTSY